MYSDYKEMAESSFNKVFILTLDFHRNILELPVPKVFDPSSTSDNPIGSEYIIMEQLQVESLGSRWLSLSTTELLDVMIQLVRAENKIFSYKFPAYGNLYYKADIAEATRINFPVDRLCVGPIAKREFWVDERERMELDRGPCKLTSQFSTTSIYTESY